MKHSLERSFAEGLPIEPLALKHVQIMLTNRCNLRCPICSIWQEKKKTTLGLKTLKEILSLLIKKTGRLECLFVTGGEPLLEYKKVLELLQMVIPMVAAGKIQEFNINTNGTLFEPLQKIAKILPGALRKRFSFSITLHGWKDWYPPSDSGKNYFQTVLQSLKFLKSLGYKAEINFVVSPFTAPYIFRAYRLARTLDCKIEFGFYSASTRSFFHYGRVLPEKRKSWMKKYAGQWDQIIQNGALRCRKFQIKYLREYMKNAKVPQEVFSKCRRSKNVMFIRCTGEIFTCLQAPAVSHFKNFKEKEWNRFICGRQNLIQSIETHGCRQCLVGALEWEHPVDLKGTA